MDTLFDLDMALAPLDLRPEEAEISGKVSAEPPLDLRTFEMPTVNASGDCAVCMDQFVPSEGSKRVPCGHVFHEACLMTWLSLHQSCPLCRFHVAGTAGRR